MYYDVSVKTFDKHNYTNIENNLNQTKNWLILNWNLEKLNKCNKLIKCSIINFLLLIYCGKKQILKTKLNLWFGICNMANLVFTVNFGHLMNSGRKKSTKRRLVIYQDEYQSHYKTTYYYKTLKVKQ